MNYIIMDLEWNQSNNGKEEVSKLLPFEIIEIGAIKLNSDRKKIDEFSRLIKPQVYHEMHRITGRLIHLEMEQLEKGHPFVEVMEEFRKWCGENYIFCTWGPLDLTELQRNMRYYGLEQLSDRPIEFLDVQKLFSIAYEDRKSRRTLEYAIDFLNIEKDIPFHRAFSDAYYISRGFDDKTQVLSDKTVTTTKCYLCDKNLRKKIRWFSPNGKHYYSVSFCEKHGYMKSKIRIRKSEDAKVYAVKTEKFITEADVESIRNKQEKSKKQRRGKKTSKNPDCQSLQS